MSRRAVLCLWVALGALVVGAPVVLVGLVMSSIPAVRHQELTIVAGVFGLFSFLMPVIFLERVLLIWEPPDWVRRLGAIGGATTPGRPAKTRPSRQVWRWPVAWRSLGAHPAEAWVLVVLLAAGPPLLSYALAGQPSMFVAMLGSLLALVILPAVAVSSALLGAALRPGRGDELLLLGRLRPERIVTEHAAAPAIGAALFTLGVSFMAQPALLVFLLRLDPGLAPGVFFAALAPGLIATQAVAASASVLAAVAGVTAGIRYGWGPVGALVAALVSLPCAGVVALAVPSVARLRVLWCVRDWLPDAAWAPWYAWTPLLALLAAAGMAAAAWALAGRAGRRLRS